MQTLTPDDKLLRNILNDVISGITAIGSKRDEFMDDSELEKVIPAGYNTCEIRIGKFYSVHIERASYVQ